VIPAFANPIIAWVKKIRGALIPHLYGEPEETRPQRVIRWTRLVVVILACLVTLQSVLLVAGAWRNDHQIESNMGVAEAEVLDAGPRRSTIEFVTPDRITYRPELGVLYPSELETGMRIYVEYDRTDPDLVRVQHRNAALALVPAGSVAVLGWIVAGILLSGLAMVQRRFAPRDTAARDSAARDSAARDAVAQDETSLDSQSSS
jgi:hypothetical protein